MNKNCLIKFNPKDIKQFNISTEAYNPKPMSDEIRKMTFHLVAMNRDGYLQCLLQGYSTAHHFNANRISTREKTYDNWNCANSIFFDIDHNQKSMDKVLEIIPDWLHPTISYTTWSDREGDRRFRFIYFLDKTIYSVDEYKDAYIELVSLIKRYDHTLNLDGSAQSATQYMNGNAQSNAKYAVSDNMVCTEHLLRHSATRFDKHLKILNINSEQSRRYFYTAFKNTFVNHMETVVEFGEYERYKYVPYRYEVPVIGENKLKDGQKRRKFLKSCAYRRLRIEPDISRHNLLWCMVIDFSNNIDNSVEPLTIEDLERISDEVYNNREKNNTPSLSPKIYVNMKYEVKEGESWMSANEVRTYAMKEMKTRHIMAAYDSDRTLNENYEIYTNTFDTVFEEIYGHPNTDRRKRVRKMEGTKMTFPDTVIWKAKKPVTFQTYKKYVSTAKPIQSAKKKKTDEPKKVKKKEHILRVHKEHPEYNGMDIVRALAEINITTNKMTVSKTLREYRSLNNP